MNRLLAPSQAFLAAVPVLFLKPDRHDAPCPKCNGGCQATAYADVGSSFRMVRYVCRMCGYDWFASYETTSGHVLPFRRVARE